MTTNELNIQVPVSMDSIVESITGRQDAKDLILAIDGKMCDVCFTLSIMADLFTSLESDLSREEILQELATLIQ